MFSQLLKILTHPLIAGPFGGGIIVCLAYLDSKLRNIKRENDTYWQLFIVCSLIIAILVYLIKQECTKSDEFLNQVYDTEVSKSMMPNKDAGYSYRQNVMTGPSTDIQKIMGELKTSPTAMFEMPKNNPFTDKVKIKTKKYKLHRHKY